MTVGGLRGLVFDLDGTLVDSTEDIAWALNGALAAHGLPPHPPAACRAMLGWGVARLVEAATPAQRREPALLRALVEAMRTRYAQRPVACSRPYRGILPLLAALRGRDVPTAVLSNKPHGLTVQVVGELFPEHPFRCVRGEGSGWPPKPDPAAALAICADLGLAPGEVLFLGDSEVDGETARRAGMPFAAALWGFRSRAQLEASGAAALLAEPAGALGLIRE